MKNYLGRIMTTLLLLALANLAALADVTSKQVTFPEDVTIEGKLFKAGTYKMKYDEKTGELTIGEGKTVAKTTARLEKRESKAVRTSISSAKDGDARVLRSITFRGENQSFVLGATGGSNQADAAAH